MTAEYSGVLDESFVYKPNDPAVWQQDFQLKWDEKETVTIGSDGRPAPGKPTITISGHIRSTYAPPNTAKSCTGTFSLRPNAPDPLMFSNDAVLALMPDLGKYVQSSSSSPDCAVAVNGAMGASGVLFPRPQLEQFSQAVAVVCSYSEDPCTKTFKVDGESPTNISSLRATFTVRGGTGGSRRPNR